MPISIVTQFRATSYATSPYVNLRHQHITPILL